MRDDDVRSACFASLDVLLAKFGEDVPYVGGLADGFPFRGRRVPFLCAIHHRAFDQNLVGISADYEVRVSRTLLDDEDGPMLDVLKGFDRATIEVPVRKAWRPDRELLAHRFERFLSFGPRDHGSTSAASPGLPG